MVGKGNLIVTMAKFAHDGGDKNLIMMVAMVATKIHENSMAT
jgi:hypothetical protein